MKRLAAIILCIILILCLCGCRNGQDAMQSVGSKSSAADVQPQVLTTNIIPKYTARSPVFQFPAGTVVCGVDLSGLEQADGYKAICHKLSGYTLSVKVNGRTVTLTAGDLALSCPESAIAELVAAMENGGDTSAIRFVTYDAAAARQKLAYSLNASPRNASIRYDPSAGCFQLSNDIAGRTVDLTCVMEELEPVVLSLGTELSVTAAEKVVEATIRSDSQEARDALAKANTYLNVSLTYAFTPDNALTQYESISKDTIASFIAFGNDLSPDIDSDALRSYVNEINTKYSVKGDSGQFKTTGGYYIDLTVDYACQPVNTDALYEDIHYCLTNGISGTRMAPYLNVLECEDWIFDGNYVEVNLSAQHLWVYRNGACVVSTPIVSGCAYYRNTTPTGVYSINSKSRGVYLVGTGYRSYVNYWMPFKGGYGLHDASWRNEFGNDIYLYDGSHGCVNLPTNVAGNVYENVSVGTKVILYGGATRAEAVPQNIVGTTEYKVPVGTQPFKLDAQPEYGKDKTLTYVSMNPEIAEVAADGTVTVKAPGTAYITVTAEARQYYTSAQMVVAIHVKDLCPQNAHNYGPWIITTPATCTTVGSQSHGCETCGFIETGVIPLLDHSFGEWVQTIAPSCTAPGEQAHTCGVCGTTETEAIPAAGHTVSSWTTTAEPTCSAPGSQTGTCDSCGESVTEQIPVVDHDFSSGGPACGFGCGTPNPDYLPPKEDEEDPTDPGDSGESTEPTE